MLSCCKPPDIVWSGNVSKVDAAGPFLCRLLCDSGCARRQTHMLQPNLLAPPHAMAV